MTKAELLKLLEPFSDDALIVIADRFAEGGNSWHYNAANPSYVKFDDVIGVYDTHVTSLPKTDPWDPEYEEDYDGTPAIYLYGKPGYGNHL